MEGTPQSGLRRPWASLAGRERVAADSPGRAVFAVAALIAIAVAYLLNNPDTRKLLIAPAGAIGLLVLWRAWSFERSHQEWLVPALMLVLLAISCSVFSGHLRAAVHYCVVLLICVPVVPMAWSSGIVKREGFKLYGIYFLWALITVTYSIAPLFSISRLAIAALIFLTVCFVANDVRDAHDVRAMFGRIAAVCGFLVLANVAALAILRGSAWQVPVDEMGIPIDQGLPTAGLMRFAGIMDNPNTIGFLMLVTVSTALICIPHYSGRRRTVLILISLLALVLAGLADSRSSFVALGAGVTIYLLWRYRGFALVAIAVALLGAAAALPLLGSNLTEYLNRGNVATLTGRTDIWQFALHEIHARPFFGYGYEVAGQIFKSPYFPIWWGPWDMGPQSSLHDGFLNRAVGMGIPATLFWLYIVLRPWVSLSQQEHDVLDLKPLFFLLVIPLLISNLTESAVGDFSDTAGLLFGLAWALAEAQRIRWLERIAARQHEERTSDSPAVVALRSLSAKA